MQRRKLLGFVSVFYGISSITAKKLCLVLGYDFRINAETLSRRNYRDIDFLVSRRLLVDKSLRLFVKQNIILSKLLKSYVGKRHSLGLPTRGQRTRSNGSTARKLSFYKDPLKKVLRKKNKK